jgi:hypothetical protein
MKTIIISAALIALFSFTDKDMLTGWWESPISPKGNITSVRFKDDQTFEGFVNKKPFVTGTYLLKDSIFTFTDNGCNGEQGIYQLVFFHNEDSLRFEPISDNCTERRNGMSRMVLGRKILLRL